MNIETAVLENLKILADDKKQQVLTYIKSLQTPEKANFSALRLPFMNKILPDLQRIHRDTDEPPSPVYADSLLRSLQAMAQQLPSDPYSILIQALHEAMAYQNNWIYYKNEQYQAAHDLLAELLPINDLTSTNIGQALQRLKQIGFNLMPYAVSISINPDESDEN